MCHFQGVSDDVVRNLSHKQVCFFICYPQFRLRNYSFVQHFALVSRFPQFVNLQFLEIGFKENQVEHAGCIPQFFVMCFSFIFSSIVPFSVCEHEQFDLLLIILSLGDRVSKDVSSDIHFTAKDSAPGYNVLFALFRSPCIYITSSELSEL